MDTIRLRARPSRTRIHFAALLACLFACCFACLPLAAHADKKGTKNPGSPGNSVLVATMADAFMIGLSAATRKEQNKGRVSATVANCVAALPGAKLYPALNTVLADRLTAEEIQATTFFFNSAAGRKFAGRVVMQSYLVVGEKPPETVPAFTDAEQKDIATFVHTGAGDKLITQKMIATMATSPLVAARATALMKACGFDEGKH